MKLLILGGTGMLGNAVGKHFLNTQHDTTLTYRNQDVIYGPKNQWIFFDVLQTQDNDLAKLVTDFDYVINCIGTIKPFMPENPIAARQINAIFPWRLAKACEDNKVKLIHITTDCVFSGRDGKYNEDSLHDALDDYGKSKSLGEPTKHSMVIRTSIIGEEVHKNASLIAWAKSQKGQTIKGFTNHQWNGITTNQYAAVCEKIIDQNLYQKGLFHVHAPNDVTKFEMMQLFNDKFDLQLTIEAVEGGQNTDRTLRTSKDLCAKLKVPTVADMIAAI